MIKWTKEYWKEYRKKYYEERKKEWIRKGNLYKKNRDQGLYDRYWQIKRRCQYNKLHPKWKYYGGRGIKVLWKSYKEFKEDMYISFREHVKKFGFKQTTIDRINVNGHYCKENCRWATYKEQEANKRAKRLN